MNAWTFDFVTHMTLTIRPTMLEKQRWLLVPWYYGYIYPSRVYPTIVHTWHLASALTRSAFYLNEPLGFSTLCVLQPYMLPP